MVILHSRRRIPEAAAYSANTRCASRESPDAHSFRPDAESFRLSLSLKEHIVGFRRICPSSVQLICVYLYIYIYVHIYINVHKPARASRWLPPHLLFFGQTYMCLSIYLCICIYIHKFAYANESISWAPAAISLLR